MLLQILSLMCHFLFFDIGYCKFFLSLYIFPLAISSIVFILVFPCPELKEILSLGNFCLTESTSSLYQHL